MIEKSTFVDNFTTHMFLSDEIQYQHSRVEVFKIMRLFDIFKTIFKKKYLNKCWKILNIQSLWVKNQLVINWGMTELVSDYICSKYSQITIQKGVAPNHHCLHKNITQIWLYLSKVFLWWRFVQHYNTDKMHKTDFGNYL